MSATSAPLLHLSGVYAGYGSKEILRGIDCEVASGEIVCVIGPNGAGKSTVLLTVLGYLKPREGEITFRGKSISHMETDAIVRLGIAYCPQGRAIFRIRAGSWEPTGGSGRRTGVRFLARRGADGLRTAQQLARLQLGARAVLAAEKARHRGRAESPGGREWRTGRLRTVAQAVGSEGSLDFLLRHRVGILPGWELGRPAGGVPPRTGVRILYIDAARFSGGNSLG